jgi:hypothetical protein
LPHNALDMKGPFGSGHIEYIGSGHMAEEGQHVNILAQLLAVADIGKDDPKK